MKSASILEQAIKEQTDRARFYDTPGGERSMAKTVAAFNAIHGTSLTEVQGWQFMELLKMVRSAQGAPRADNYVDGASYAALAGEAALASVSGDRVSPSWGQAKNNPHDGWGVESLLKSSACGS